MKVIVLSDDLTGAAEVAGAALRLGASAEVHIGELHDTEAEVVAIDADTRSLDPKDAAAVVRRLTRQSLESAGSMLLKKVDSVLRGPVLAEIDAIQATMGLDRCLLVCGNPRKRRVVLNGEIFIGEEPLHATEFAFDPEHPCTSSNAIALLRQGSDCRIPDPLSLATRNLQMVAPGAPIERGVSIGNVADSEQLQVYAEHWLSQRQSVLAAGAAEFIEAILEQCMGRRLNVMEKRHHLEEQRSCGSTLLISGTRIPHHDDWPVVSIREELSLSQCVATACQLLTREGRAAIHSSNTSDVSPESRLSRLTNVAKQVLWTANPREVWIEGGKTASTLLRQLGQQRLKAVSNVGDGIVSLRSIDDAAPLFVVKPGSYPWSTIRPLELRLSSPNGYRETV